MIQSGILYTIDSTGIPTDSPIKGVFMLFKQNSSLVKKIQTDKDTGAYSVDLNTGKYTVELAIGLTTNPMRGGELFELKDGNAEDALQRWMYAKSGSIDDVLLNSFKEVLDQVNQSALNAKESEEEAKRQVDSIQQQMQNNSVGDDNGQWMKEGAGGWMGSTKGVPSLFDFKSNPTTQIIDHIHQEGSLHQRIFSIRNGVSTLQNTFVRFPYRANVDAFEITTNYSGVVQTARFYSDRNTTVDSNGNIKKASPIIKLFYNRIEWNEFFKEAPIFEKLDIGVYKISNTNGLARGIVHGDWYIETPKNRNGFPYFMVDWEQDSVTDDIIIRTFKRKFDNDIGDFVNGEPRDIGENERWIDLRFHEQIYALETNRSTIEINTPWHPLWGIIPYVPPLSTQTEENIALLDQRAF